MSGIYPRALRYAKAQYATKLLGEMDWISERINFFGSPDSMMNAYIERLKGRSLIHGRLLAHLDLIPLLPGRTEAFIEFYTQLRGKVFDLLSDVRKEPVTCRGATGNILYMMISGAAVGYTTYHVCTTTGASDGGAIVVGLISGSTFNPLIKLLQGCEEFTNMMRSATRTCRALCCCRPTKVAKTWDDENIDHEASKY
jgi:hypothetical protein